MPHIHITAAENSLNKIEQAELVKDVSNAVLKAERAPINDAGAQSLVWAYYDEMPASSIYVGGENLVEPPIRIAVTTPQGALTASTRQSLAADIGQIIDKYIGSFEGRLNHWTMFYEVSEGSWAGGGQIFSLAAIQTAMNINAA